MSGTAQKKKIIEEVAIHDGDTGSPEVQISLLTTRIKELSKHLKKNKKDVPTRRALLKMVAGRRRLLGYLERTDKDRYKALIKKIEI